jgi:rhodanese-related sulfurtransferase
MTAILWVVATVCILVYPRGYTKGNTKLTKLFKILSAAFIAAFAVTGLAGCSAEEPVDMSQYAAVIDVRTPAETSAGHLDGALLYDVQDPSFMASLETLDKEADYYIYCRSGNRSGQAIQIMKQAGFTGQLANGGSLANAAAETGIAVVK